MIEVGEAANRPTGGVLNAVVAAATHGTVIVVAAVRSLNRYGTQAHSEGISGVTDTQGNTYTLAGSFGAELPYYIGSSLTGWSYGRIAVFTATGTLDAGDTVSIACSVDTTSGPPVCAAVFDSDDLGGAPSTATAVYPEIIPGGLRDLADADALGVTLNATNSAYGALAVSWPNADLAAWVEGYTTFIYGAVTTDGWSQVTCDYLFIAYPAGVTPTQFHLSIQHRAFRADEDHNFDDGSDPL